MALIKPVVLCVTFQTFPKAPYPRTFPKLYDAPMEPPFNLTKMSWPILSFTTEPAPLAPKLLHITSFFTKSSLLYITLFIGHLLWLNNLLFLICFFCFDDCLFYLLFWFLMDLTFNGIFSFLRLCLHWLIFNLWFFAALCRKWCFLLWYWSSCCIWLVGNDL